MVNQSDALAYLTLVKRTFAHTPEKYVEFIKIMTDFFNKRVDTDAVIQRAKNVFEGRAELIQGFNKFLPDGYQIRVSSVKKVKKPIEFSDALRFVNKVKTRFHGGSRYKSFLDILNRYKTQPQISPADPSGLKEVYKQVVGLFGVEHRDLAEEFARFSPLLQQRRMPSRTVDELSRRLSRL